MPKYYDGNKIVVVTGGEVEGRLTYEYSRFFAWLHRKKGKVFRTKEVADLNELEQEYSVKVHYIEKTSEDGSYQVDCFVEELK